MTIFCHNVKMYSAEELAARVGITPRMVRYRARIGLLRTTRRLAEQIRHIGEMYGRVDPLAALDFEQEKALQLLRTQRVSTSGDERSPRA